MENKNYKHIKRNNSVISLIDLRLEYKYQTGDPNVPLSHSHYDDVNYIVWLEDKIIKLKQLKQELIPWEPLNRNK